jgi:methylglyoxal synthase
MASQGTKKQACINKRANRRRGFFLVFDGNLDLHPDRVGDGPAPERSLPRAAGRNRCLRRWAGRSRHCLSNLTHRRGGRRPDQHCIRAETDRCADTAAWNLFDTASRYTSTAICETRNDSKSFQGTRTVALVAHDNHKQDLVDWAHSNRDVLIQHNLIATGATGALLHTQLDLPVTKLHSGPLGGDQQLGALIVEGAIDFLIFFWDPLQSHPHEADVRALLRIAVVWNVPFACNRATANLMISSPCWSANKNSTSPTTLITAQRKDDSCQTDDTLSVNP